MLTSFLATVISLTCLIGIGVAATGIVRDIANQKHIPEAAQAQPVPLRSPLEASTLQYKR